MILVPNQFPRFLSSQRLAIIGEAPGTDEVNNLDARGNPDPKPFVGASGRLLKGLLGALKISSEQVYLGNVCQYQPEGNKISNFAWEGTEIQAGITQLREDMAAYKPTMILGLGTTALRFLNPDVCYYDKDEFVVPISDYRGSLFWSPTLDCKSLAAYHPAYVLRDYSSLPLLRFDINRAWLQAAFRELNLPQRQFVIRPTIQQVTDFLNDVIIHKRKVAFDVEGYNDNVGITMLSIFTSPNMGIVIPLWIDGSHYWSLEDEVLVWELLARLMSDASIHKIVQNGAYEIFMFLWKFRLICTGITDDTMFKHWECFPEFEKSLAMQCSIYTLEPFYKNERTSGNTDVKLTYNAKDSGVTFECSNAQDSLISQQPSSSNHYLFNMDLLYTMVYMQCRGTLISTDAITKNQTENEAELATVQAELDSLVGQPINAKSTPQKAELLYDILGYEPSKRWGRVTDEETLHRYYLKHRNPIVKKLIRCVNLRTRRSDINKLSTNADGRIRCNFNLVGTNTGRLSSTASNALEPAFTKTGILKWVETGTNLQNVTKELRECFVSDPGKYFFQCDLYGADAWTVGADLAALGHPTMLEDLVAGVKPAKVLLLMLEEYEAGRNPAIINGLAREELLRRTALLKFPDVRDSEGRQGDWKYLCMKRCQHGTNYGMKPELLSETIFKDSDGTIDLTTKEAGIYQYLYRLRYNPDARTEWITRELRDKGVIRTAAGIQRRFYGLRWGVPDHKVVREALAFEPQANTTFVTNKALYNLWYDPENHTSKGALFIEPLIQVHDALCGQFGINYLDWARTKIHAYFQNPIIIHGIQINIPYEGNYGPDWRYTKTPL